MDRGELKTEARGVIKDRLWDFWKPLLVNYFIGMLIQLVLMQFLPIPTDLEPWEISTNEIIISAILDLLTLPIVMGVNKYHLDYVRGKDPKLSSLKDYFVKFLPILGIYLVTTILTTLGMICFIVPGIIIGLALNFVYYLYIDEEKGVIETVKNCFTLMNGHKWDLFVLMLSFLGWALLGALTFGILYIWIVPYMNTTLILFYDKLREAK